MLLHKKVLDWLAFCNSTELKHNLKLLCCEKGLFTAFKNTYTIYPFEFPGFHWDTWCSRKRCCKPALHCSALRVRTHCVLQGRRWLCNTCALCSCGGSQSPSEWNVKQGSSQLTDVNQVPLSHCTTQDPCLGSLGPHWGEHLPWFCFEVLYEVSIKVRIPNFRNGYSFSLLFS